MADSLRAQLDGMPLRNAKAELRTGEGARRNPTPHGALVDQARKRAGLEVKQMAAEMGVSESFLLRGFKDHEHISVQRLQQLGAAFQREFVIVQAEAIADIEVVTEIRVKRSA